MASFIDLSAIDFAHPPEHLACMGMPIQLYNDNDQMDDEEGRILHLVNHHSAGSYTLTCKAYHFGVGFDVHAPRVCLMRNLKLHQKGQHLWGRNTGACGNAMLAEGPEENPQHRRPEQVETLALLNAEQCFVWGLNPRGTITLPKKRIVGNSLVTVPGEYITMPIISDHSEFAKQDGYYPDRVDIEHDIAYVRAQAAKYYDELVAGTRALVFKSLLQP